MHAWWKKIRLMYDIDHEKFFTGPNADHPYRWHFFHGTMPASALYMSLQCFYTVVDMLGSDRQRDLWCKKIQNLNIIGAYA